MNQRHPPPSLVSQHPPCRPALPCTAPPACSLEKPETLASSEVLAAMCHLLSLVLGRVPNSILRSKFAAGSQVVCNIVEAKQVGGWLGGDLIDWKASRQADGSSFQLYVTTQPALPAGCLKGGLCARIFQLPRQADRCLHHGSSSPHATQLLLPLPAHHSPLSPMQGDAAVVKNAVPCLGQLLAAFNHADWPSAVRPFNLLLRWAHSTVQTLRAAACSGAYVGIPAKPLAPVYSGCLQQRVVFPWASSSRLAAFASTRVPRCAERRSQRWAMCWRGCNPRRRRWPRPARASSSCASGCCQAQRQRRMRQQQRLARSGSRQRRLLLLQWPMRCTCWGR